MVDIARMHLPVSVRDIETGTLLTQTALYIMFSSLTLRVHVVTIVPKSRIRATSVLSTSYPTAQLDNGVISLYWTTNKRNGREDSRVHRLIIDVVPLTPSSLSCL